MIYTITFNPSLDYYLKINTAKNGNVYRSSSERLSVGGKGINVSLALNALGEETMSLGFVAGFTGKAIKDDMNHLGVNHRFYEVEGQSRINVKIKATTETDINGTGALVTERDVNKMISYLKRNLQEGDWLVISGSVPSTLNDTVYAEVLKKLSKLKNIYIVIDASGRLLTNTLAYKPFLIKPNIYELCDIFGVSAINTIPDTKTIITYARALQENGARNVIVSMGSGGALMVTETQQVLYVRAANGEVVNSVGAGDSMIAGFIHEYRAYQNYFASLNFATAAGTACAFSNSIPTKEQTEYVERLML
jgi:1-phosphofructokinase